MKKIAALNIVVDGLPLTCGVEVDTDLLPAGCVDSMLRLGQLVDPDDWIEEHPEAVAAEVETVEEEMNVLDTATEDLQLGNSAKAALIAAGLVTVRKILEYGSEHETLTTISGIGTASEKQIQQALTALQKR
jgi:hypothetical protein